MFRIDLDTFRGPLDLLLYLVRKHEIPISEIPIAQITEQYIEYIEVLEQLDVNAVGDFLELASTLMEIKSKMILPQLDDQDQEIEDPRDELVQRLLEYKKYRDASSMLEERSRDWQQHCPRVASDLPERRIDPSEQPIREVELWDLVSAFGRVIRDRRAAAKSKMVYDETSIHVYMKRM